MPPADAPSDAPSEATGEKKVTKRVDAVLATRPVVSSDRCAEALSALTHARDAERDAARRGGYNLLISLVMGVKHPLGVPPWDALADARRTVLPVAGDRHDG